MEKNSSEWKNYKCIEFDGLALNPTFSIYMFEIEKEDNKFFYIGMTGDHYYPSARSILHRLAGHITIRESTQNQFINALKNIVLNNVEKLTLENLATLKIKLHHWPIAGFKTWNGSLTSFDITSNEYKMYKKSQSEIMQLEQKIIGDFNKKLLNKTKGKSELKIDKKYIAIYCSIKKIINNE